MHSHPSTTSKLEYLHTLVALPGSFRIHKCTHTHVLLAVRICTTRELYTTRHAQTQPCPLLLPRVVKVMLFQHAGVGNESSMELEIARVDAALTQENESSLHKKVDVIIFPGEQKERGGGRRGKRGRWMRGEAKGTAKG